MDESGCLASKGRNFALINKLVTEIGHTSERKGGRGGGAWMDCGGGGGAAGVMESSRLPSQLVQEAGETKYWHCLAQAIFPLLII